MNKYRKFNFPGKWNGYWSVALAVSIALNLTWHFANTDNMEQLSTEGLNPSKLKAEQIYEDSILSSFEQEYLKKGVIPPEYSSYDTSIPWKRCSIEDIANGIKLSLEHSEKQNANEPYLVQKLTIGDKYLNNLYIVEYYKDGKTRYRDVSRMEEVELTDYGYWCRIYEYLKSKNHPINDVYKRIYDEHHNKLPRRINIGEENDYFKKGGQMPPIHPFVDSSVLNQLKLLENPNILGTEFKSSSAVRYNESNYKSVQVEMTMSTTNYENKEETIVKVGADGIYYYQSPSTDTFERLPEPLTPPFPGQNYEPLTPFDIPGVDYPKFEYSNLNGEIISKK